MEFFRSVNILIYKIGFSFPFLTPDFRRLFYFSQSFFEFFHIQRLPFNFCLPYLHVAINVLECHIQQKLCWKYEELEGLMKKPVLTHSGPLEMSTSSEISGFYTGQNVIAIALDRQGVIVGFAPQPNGNDQPVPWVLFEGDDLASPISDPENSLHPLD